MNERSHPRVGAILIALLGGVSAVAAWGAVRLDSPGLDGDHSVLVTTGLCAAGFCLTALVKIVRAVRGRSTWLNASLWLLLAVISLFALLVFTFATRLGG